MKRLLFRAKPRNCDRMVFPAATFQSAKKKTRTTYAIRGGKTQVIPNMTKF